MDQTEINKHKKIKMVLIQIAMCLIAYATWGHWLVNVIKIISFKQFLHVVTAPINIGMTTISFSLNIIVIKRKIKAIENYSKNQNSEGLLDAKKSMAYIQNFIMGSLISINLICPFISMSMLFYPDWGFFISTSIDNPQIVYIGALSAAGLSYVFFVPFINSIMKCIEDISCEIPSSDKDKMTISYTRFARLSFVSSIGTILLIGTTILSVIISTSKVSNNIAGELFDKTVFISIFVSSGIVTNYLSFKKQMKKLKANRAMLQVN